MGLIDTGSSGSGGDTGTLDADDVTYKDENDDSGSTTTAGDLFRGTTGSGSTTPTTTETTSTEETSRSTSDTVNDLLRSAENIDKDGDTTTVHVESSPSSGPPVHGGAGGSQPGEDPYEDPDKWDPYDIGEGTPGTAGLVSGRETGSTGPAGSDAEIVGSDPREDLPDSGDVQNAANDAVETVEDAAGDAADAAQNAAQDAQDAVNDAVAGHMPEVEFDPTVELDGGQLVGGLIVGVAAAGVASKLGGGS